MVKRQKDTAAKTKERKSIRPALIMSEHIMSDYSIILHHLLAGLADESIQSALVCRPGNNLESVVLPLVEIINHPFLELPLMGRQNKKILVERLEKFSPTVLHCLCESKAKLTRQLARHLDLPYVLTVNSLQKAFGQLAVSPRRCAKIIVPAKSIATNISNVYPRLAEQIEQINVGTFVSEKVRCLRERGRPGSVVTAYRLDNVDDFENLFGAVRHLAIDGYEFMLVITGGGRAENQVRKLLSALGLLEIVIIVPRPESWRRVLEAGDIYVQPAASNAFDPLLLEAMSAGVAVAGCKGGVDELIIEGKTAIVFDAEDELSIYNALQQLFDRPELAQQLARGGQEYVRENHTVSKMVSDILRTYLDAGQWYGR